MPDIVLTIPTTLRCARIAHAGGREGRSVHLITDLRIATGHYRREPGDPLCRPASCFPHLNVYALRTVSIAECCPQCLHYAVRARFLERHQVDAAERAYAQLRVVPAPLEPPAAPPPIAWWRHLPCWNELPVRPGATGPSTTAATGFSRLAVAARQQTPHPEPIRQAMDGAWFLARVVPRCIGNIHRCPVILRIPAPASASDHIPVLAGSSGQPGLHGTPIARLGNDIVLSVSAFAIVLRFHQPDGFPGGLAPYRTLLKSWHQYSLTPAHRIVRRGLRVTACRTLQAGGATISQIAGWMFEGLPYITELLAQPSPSHA